MTKEVKFVSKENNSTLMNTSAHETCILTPKSSIIEIKSYFKAVLKLSQSDQEFPVNLDEVWALVYSSKEKAVRALKENFIQSIDYQFLTQKGENSKGRPRIEYLLSVPCMEFFIARKVRPVFEVYRKVFHKTASEPSKAVRSKEVDKLKEEIGRLEYQLKWARIDQQRETDLKNSCFFFLVGKGLYTEYHSWMQKRITDNVIKEIKKSLDA